MERIKSAVFDSSDLHAKIGQTVIGSFDAHGIGEYMIVAKKPLNFGGHRFYVKWALDIPAFRERQEARYKAMAEEASQVAACDVLYRRGRLARADLAAREDHLRVRGGEFHGRKRHGFTYRANRVHGEIVDAGRE